MVAGMKYTFNVDFQQSKKCNNDQEHMSSLLGDCPPSNDAAFVSCICIFTTLFLYQYHVVLMSVSVLCWTILCSQTCIKRSPSMWQRKNGLIRQVSDLINISSIYMKFDLSIQMTA